MRENAALLSQIFDHDASHFGNGCYSKTIEAQRFCAVAVQTCETPPGFCAMAVQRKLGARDSWFEAESR